MKIQVCNWKSCKSHFSEYITKRLNWDIEKFDIQNVIVEECACMWECRKWPNVKVDWKIENYSDPIKISKIICERVKCKPRISVPKK